MLSEAIKGWKMADKAFSNESKKYRRKQQYKIFRFALLNPTFAKKWFDLLCSEEYLFIRTHRPRLFMKPFRVYMSVLWNKEQRLRAILDTYQFLKERKTLLEQFMIAQQPISVSTFELKDSSRVCLCLGYDERFRKEGELVFFLKPEVSGAFIAGASFSFENTEKEGWVCRIGCVQGADNDHREDKLLQKQMNGLRPKALMIFAIIEFAKDLGISTVYGAGQSIQSFRKKHAIYIERFHKINFNYDKFWKELNGIESENGWFLLPLEMQRKKIEELDTSKRATYRRRYVMMDKIAENISVFILNPNKEDPFQIQ